MDLIVRRAQLTDRPSGQHLDIGIDGGRIVAIEPNLAAEGATYDAALQRFFRKTTKQAATVDRYSFKRATEIAGEFVAE
jgi:dihydroorotase-like cyclic amidohydrolase